MCSCLCTSTVVNRVLEKDCTDNWRSAGPFATSASLTTDQRPQGGRTRLNCIFSQALESCCPVVAPEMQAAKGGCRCRSQRSLHQPGLISHWEILMIKSVRRRINASWSDGNQYSTAEFQGAQPKEWWTHQAVFFGVFFGEHQSQSKSNHQENRLARHPLKEPEKGTGKALAESKHNKQQSISLQRQRAPIMYRLVIHPDACCIRRTLQIQHGWQEESFFVGFFLILDSTSSADCLLANC